MVQFEYIFLDIFKYCDILDILASGILIQHFQTHFFKYRLPVMFLP